MGHDREWENLSPAPPPVPITKSEVDGAAAGFKRLTVSGKRKRTTLAEAGTEVRIPPCSIRDGVHERQRLNREEIRDLNLNRGFIVQNQPWVSNELPRGYLPHPSTKWYPPIFCLGVALSLQETEEFAQHLGIPLDEMIMYRHGISRRLTELCGAKSQIMVERCDKGKSPEEDRIWLFSLATNYDIHPETDLNEPLRKYREIVEKAFGPSKKVAWWLEYTVNHDPGHWWVSNEYPITVVAAYGAC